MKITEIEIDDSQTGYYWLQIYVKNKKQAIGLKHQILNDEAIHQRLENTIKQSQKIVATSSNKMEMSVHNFLIDKLLYVLEGNGDDDNQIPS